MLSFLHLSDIHFRRDSGNVTDVDEDLRNELILDAKSFAEKHGQPDGILVSGDIGYSGQKSEYEFAEKWVNQLAHSVGRDGPYVWCVPGNHDVDQSKVHQSEILRTLHDALRDLGPDHIDGKLADYLQDIAAGDSLFSTIESYNKYFASKLGCEITKERPFWEEYFTLDDSSKLRINGINSTIVSDHKDNTYQKIIIGRYQLPQRHSGVVDLLLCHHPTDWWRDSDQLIDAMEDRCRIQLFGHKHAHRLKRSNDTVVLSAGAVHPDRREPLWEPRYNWLKIRVETTTEVRKLIVEVFPRVWNNDRFIADTNNCAGQDSKIITIELEAWTAPEPARENAECTEIPSESTVTFEEGTPMNRSRILTYRFLELSHIDRLDIVRELNLMRNEDEGLTDSELLRRILKRAHDENLLADLWDRIQKCNPHAKYQNNPYRS